MSKTRKHTKKSQGVVDRSATTDVVTQLEIAVRNPHAALIGALIGGLVPWFGRTLAHGEIQSASSRGLAVAMIGVVLGCALFSALSVYKFGKAAFGDARKAFGFVLALEGVMLVSHGATSNVALAVLILINAVANGSVIALARDATRRRMEADARRSATRACGRRQVPAVQEQAAPASSSSVRRPTARPATTPVVVTPVWRRPSFDDVIDAEIVSQERLLA